MTMGEIILAEGPCHIVMKNPKTPFCTESSGRAVCGEENTCASKMGCRYQGIFPDPLSCNKFNNCPAKGQNSTIIPCPPKSIYDHGKRMCTTTTTACVTFAMTDTKGLCYNKDGQFVTHPNDPAVYVFCSNNTVDQLKTCEHPDMRLNTKTYSCEYNCRVEGFFPNPANATQFFICTKEGVNFIPEIRDCPADSLFDGKVGFCVHENGSQATTPVTTPAD